MSKQIPTVISPPQVYSAVPPPQNLTGVQSSAVELEAVTSLTNSSMSTTVVLKPVPPASLVGVTGVTASHTLGTTPQPTGHLSSGHQANVIGYTPPPLVSGGTSYIGYGGIYPQATPLQQVALALRHSPPVASTVDPTTLASNGESKPTSFELEKEKRPPQKRKFQELPVGSKGTAKPNQVIGLSLIKSLKTSLHALRELFKSLHLIVVSSKLANE